MLDRADGAGRALKDRPRDSRGDHRELFQNQRRFQMTEPKSAIEFREVDAEKSHPGITSAHRLGEGYPFFLISRDRSISSAPANLRAVSCSSFCSSLS